MRYVVDADHQAAERLEYPHAQQIRPAGHIIIDQR
jgi:hypothetical protein